MSSNVRITTALIGLIGSFVSYDTALAQVAPVDAVSETIAPKDDDDYFLELAPDPVPEPDDNIGRMIAALRSDMSTKAATLGNHTFGIILRRGEGWPPHVPIKVCFRDGDAALQRNVVAVANDWNFAGTPLPLDFGNLAAPRQCPASTEDISVSLINGISKSPVGPASQNSIMQLAVLDVDRESAKFRQIVLHEFGHALGLFHELKHADADCWSEFNLPKLKAFYSREYSITDEAKIKAEIGKFDPVQMDARFFTTGFDASSAMMYAFPPEVFNKQKASKCFARTAVGVSSRDKDTVRLAYSGPRVAAASIAALTANESQGTIKLANAFNSLLLARPGDLKSLEQAAKSLPPTAAPGEIAEAVLARSQQISAQTWGVR